MPTFRTLDQADVKGKRVLVRVDLNAPMQDGERANGVNVTASGDVQWVLGNLGDIPTVTIDYQTYDAAGWTIAASESGTRFTNEHTGHGMFVSIENVETF